MEISIKPKQLWNQKKRQQQKLTLIPAAQINPSRSASSVQANRLHFSSQLAQVHFSGVQAPQHLDSLANIPVIDLLQLKKEIQSPDKAGQPMIQKMGHALRDVGFFAMTGLDLLAPPALFDQHYKATETLFNALRKDPERYKKLYLYQQGIERGVHPAGEVQPVKMALGKQLDISGLHIELVEEQGQPMAKIRHGSNEKTVAFPKGLFDPKQESPEETSVTIDGFMVRLRRTGVDITQPGGLTVVVPDSKENWLSGASPNFYPIEHPAFQQANRAVYHALEAIGVEVVQALSLYLEDTNKILLNRVVDESGRYEGDSMMRAIHYPAYTAEEMAGTPDEAEIIRAGAHKDISLITLLPQASTQGLQLQQKDGSWLSIYAQQGMVLVNAGDTLRLMTEGLKAGNGESREIVSTLHRVVGDKATVATKRYASPLFFNVNWKKDLVNLATSQPAHAVDLDRKIDVVASPGLRYLHARHTASRTLPPGTSYKAYETQMRSMSERLKLWVDAHPELNVKWIED